MHTYRRMPQGDGVYLYTVGFEVPNETVEDFRAMKDFKREEDAAAYASYLNGGDHPRKPFPAETI